MNSSLLKLFYFFMRSKSQQCVSAQSLMPKRRSKSNKRAVMLFSPEWN